MGFRILVAEDEALVRKDLCEMLDEMGHSVVAQAQNGGEAIRLFENTTPDICILDIEMPIKSGIEVARVIGNRSPVIFLSAYSDPQLIREAKDVGSMAYLTKPFRERDISHAIELAVTNFLKMTTLSDQLTRLKEQLSLRKKIEQAKGLLMEHERMTEGEAYRHMQKLSMRKNISMERIAEAIILTHK